LYQAISWHDAQSFDSKGATRCPTLDEHDGRGFTGVDMPTTPDHGEGRSRGGACTPARNPHDHRGPRITHRHRRVCHGPMMHPGRYAMTKEQDGDSAPPPPITTFTPGSRCSLFPRRKLKMGEGKVIGETRLYSRERVGSTMLWRDFRRWFRRDPQRLDLVTTAAKSVGG
jgi:hypothetical protein